MLISTRSCVSKPLLPVRRVSRIMLPAIQGRLRGVAIVGDAGLGSVGRRGGDAGVARHQVIRAWSGPGRECCRRRRNATAGQRSISICAWAWPPRRGRSHHSSSTLAAARLGGSAQRPPGSDRPLRRAGPGRSARSSAGLALRRSRRRQGRQPGIHRGEDHLGDQRSSSNSSMRIEALNGSISPHPWPHLVEPGLLRLHTVTRKYSPRGAASGGRRGGVLGRRVRAAHAVSDEVCRSSAAQPEGMGHPDQPLVPGISAFDGGCPDHRGGPPLLRLVGDPRARLESRSSHCPCRLATGRHLHCTHERYRPQPAQTCEVNGIRGRNGAAMRWRRWCGVHGVP